MTVLDKLTYAASPEVAGRPARRPRRAGRRRHRRRRDRRPARRSPRRGRPPRGGVAQRQLARRPEPVHPDQPGRHLRRCSRPRARPTCASTTSRPTRSTATSPSTTPSGSPRTRRTDPAAPTPPTKAGSDHLVRAWVRSFGVRATHLQLLQQLRPVAARREVHPPPDHRGPRGPPAPALRRRLNRSATGSTSTTTARPLLTILERGRIGETYLVGADGERTNLEVVRLLLRLLGATEDDFELVADRAGHDQPLRDRVRQAPPRAGLAAAVRRLRGRACADTIEWYRAHQRLVARRTRPPPRRRTPRRAVMRATSPSSTTPIPGLLVVRLRPSARTTAGGSRSLAARADDRRSGCPDFAPVQANIACNAARGTTRGLHAEPWDKLVTSPPGASYGAWVDLRAGDVVRHGLHDRPRARRRGVRAARSRQRLPDARRRHRLLLPGQRPLAAGRAYPAVDHADPALAIAWPIPLDETRASPTRTGPPRPLADVDPIARHARRSCSAPTASSAGRCARPSRARRGVDPRRARPRPTATPLEPGRGASTTSSSTPRRTPRSTRAETPEGRRRPGPPTPTAPRPWPRWRPRTASRWCTSPPTTSSTAPRRRARRGRAAAPLGVYGQTKAAGDVAVATAPRALRAAHVLGGRRRRELRAHDGRGSPTRASTPIGRRRPGRPADLRRRARARHAPPAGRRDAPYGTYHVSNGGPPMSWADVAREVFRAPRPRPGRRHAGQHRGVRRRPGPGAAAGRAACSRPAPDRGAPASSPATRRRRCAPTPRACAVVVVEPDDVVLAG